MYRYDYIRYLLEIIDAQGSSNYLYGFTNPNNILISVDGWAMGLRKLDFRILDREIIRTPINPIIIVRCTDFLGHECSDLGVGPNNVLICKSIQIIGLLLLLITSI